MTNETSQPPMAWRYCGNQIKLWRTHAGISREQLAEEAGYEYESIKSMEQGRRKPALRVLEIADEMCGAVGKLVAGAGYLQPEKFPSRVQDYLAVEAEAIAIHAYQPLLIPGLLQTKEYARQLISTFWPPVDDETAEERIQARLMRQETMRQRPATLFTFIIYEAALSSQVGGREVMRRQLHHLVEAGELQNVCVQVLPIGSAPTIALGGSLIVLETDQHKHYAYVEGQGTSILHTDPKTVSALSTRHDLIRFHALSFEESTQFIGKLAEDL
ncbi:helix-turn-helix transcriptional regulator [Streptomyces sp. NPDC049577]|uniref:helix-turn-helix domain-containing protein n=1 Tax=Streptomyces sp. NPDC049577 TaxID=3155153 RepID=UPI0034279889